MINDIVTILLTTCSKLLILHERLEHSFTVGNVFHGNQKHQLNKKATSEKKANVRLGMVAHVFNPKRQRQAEDQPDLYRKYQASQNLPQQ